VSPRSHWRKCLHYRLSQRRLPPNTARANPMPLPYRLTHGSLVSCSYTGFSPPIKLILWSSARPFSQPSAEPPPPSSQRFRILKPFSTKFVHRQYFLCSRRSLAIRNASRPVPIFPRYHIGVGSSSDPCSITTRQSLGRPFTHPRAWLSLLADLWSLLVRVLG
jgi:hypothetical protein